MSTKSTFSIVRGLRWTWIAVFLLCGTANILMLTGALYMLQVYDRVLSSQSVPTLLALSALAGGLYLGLGAIDAIRSQIMVRLASRVDERLMTAAYAASLRLPLMGCNPTEAGQPVRDADTVRHFLSGPGPVALLDLPWAPLYLGLVYLISPPLAWAALVGLVVILLLTLATELSTQRHEAAAMHAAAQRNMLSDASLRSAATLNAMGMNGHAVDRFNAAHDELVETQSRVSDKLASFGSASRMLRLALQSLMVGLGAYLAIKGDVSAGAIIAASIAAGRALAPFEQAISQWKGFVSFRQARARLKQVPGLGGSKAAAMRLPAPCKRLTLDKVTVVVPGTSRIVVQDVSLTVEAGSTLGIAGESAAGKSSLARAIVGLWPVVRGSVRIDDAPLDQWSPERLGKHIGYLPQEVELLPGTIAENIARLDPEADHDAIIRAAKAAGVHEMILHLPNGYETELSPGAPQLSGGQRQRIGLARALYGEPFLVVLDEPNSNLDAGGESALLEAMAHVRKRGGVAIVIAHRNSLLSQVDKVVVLHGGRLSRVLEPRAGAMHDLAKTRLERLSLKDRLARTANEKEAPHA